MKIFLSYEWNSAYDVADAIQESMSNEYCFEISRDIALKKTADIFAFMQTIRQHDCLIVIITPEYLKKLHCMHELILFGKEKDFIQRIIPIIINGADIFTANGRNDIRLFWEQYTVPDINDDFYRIHREISGNVLHVLEDVARVNAAVAEGKSREDLAKLCNIVKELLFHRLFSYEMRDGYIGVATDLRLDSDPMLCIDFGTSYTLASVRDVFGKTHLIPDLSQRTIMPSIVTFLPQNGYAVGNLAEKYSSKNVTTIRELKRLVGKTDYVRTDINGSAISIKALLGIFFTTIKRNAYTYTGANFRKAIISIPTSFALVEKNILTESAKLAGLAIFRIVQEPSLPSLCIVKNDNIDDEIIMILDIGGGTTDCSLAEIGDGVSEILLTQGDRFIGSIDIDKALADYIVSEISTRYNNRFNTLRDSWVYHQILQQAEMIKIAMNSAELFPITIELLEDYNGNITYFTLTLTKTKFEQITFSVLKKIENFLLNMKNKTYELMSIRKEEYGLTNDFNKIFLTGQGAKLYLIKDLLHTLYPNCCIYEEYAESAVVNGLAVQAGILQGNDKGILLLDVNHIDLYVMIAYLDENNIIHIDCDPSKNNQICELVSNHKTIPLKCLYPIKFCGDVFRQFSLSVICSTDGNADSVLKSFSVTPGDNLHMLNIDIDASSNLNIRLHSSLDKDFDEYQRSIHTQLRGKGHNPPIVIKSVSRC